MQCASGNGGPVFKLEVVSIFLFWCSNDTCCLERHFLLCLERIKFNVVTVVANLRPKSQKLWNELNVNHLNTFFENPHDPKCKVQVFADVPHPFKLIRNNILDSGFVLRENKKITKASIEQLLDLECGEIKIFSNLTQYHLSVKGRDCQSVYLATQLFSSHIAKNLH